MKTMTTLCAVVVSAGLLLGCGGEKTSSDKKTAKGGKQGSADVFQGAMEKSPWVVKDLGPAGFPGLTMRVPKNAEIKKDPINNKVGHINNMDGFALWLFASKLDVAQATKDVEKGGLRPFKGWVEKTPDHLIYKFKGITGKTQLYFQVAVKAGGKDYTCKMLGGISVSEKELPRVKQVVAACKTLKKK